MAAGTSSKETLSNREEALLLLERGRAELSAEARWLRDRVNPKEALKRGVENHPGLLVGGGLALGLMATLLLLRRRHGSHRHHTAPGLRPSHALEGRPSLGGRLVSEAAHLLLPLVVMPLIEKFVKPQLQRSPPPH